MKRLFVALCAVLIAGGIARAQQPAVPQIPYTASDPLKLPANLYLGEAAGVAINAQGDIFVYNRGQRTQLFEFGPDGAFMRTIGDGLYGFSFAHAVRIDQKGNIWCVDEGANMIIKFSPQGRVLMVLGRKPESVEGSASPGAGPTRPDWFNRPTDVTWDPAGNIFISDGYGNSRVAKFDSSGDLVKSWGKKGTAPGEFNLPHTIAADAKGDIYVGDRSNSRIQVFDSNGNFLRLITGIGSPWAICITPGPHQVLFSSDSAATGRIYKLDLEGHVLGYFGKKGKRTGEFGWVHEIACPSENVIYVGELLNWRVQKIVLHPQK